MAGFSTTLGHKYTKYDRWNGFSDFAYSCRATALMLSHQV